MPLADRDRAWCERVLAENELGWLALTSSDGPYAVPVNYFWHDGRILIHTGLTGRKLDCLGADDRVCFGVGRAEKELAPHGRAGCYHPWSSVLVFGRARIVSDPQEMLEPLQAFLSAYDPLREQPPLAAADLTRVRLVVIEPERITGREEPGR